MLRRQPLHYRVEKRTREEDERRRLCIIMKLRAVHPYYFRSDWPFRWTVCALCRGARWTGSTTLGSTALGSTGVMTHSRQYRGRSASTIKRRLNDPKTLATVPPRCRGRHAPVEQTPDHRRTRMCSSPQASETNHTKPTKQNKTNKCQPQHTTHAHTRNGRVAYWLLRQLSREIKQNQYQRPNQNQTQTKARHTPVQCSFQISPIRR